MDFTSNNILIPFYIIFFFTTIIFSFLMNRIMLKFSRTLGIRGMKEEEFVRWGPKTKPSLGGLSFYIIFLFSISVLSMLPLNASILNKELLGLLLASTLGFVIGLTDDAYNTNPLLKFLGQFTCANILISMGIYIDIAPNITINYFITTFWVLGIMNSINMLDNMDGISSITSILIIATAIGFIMIENDLTNIFTIILLGILAVLIGFLFFNWHPSKMYMGDTGTQFLGAFLSAISILFFWKYENADNGWFQINQFLIPILIFIVPITDTSTVFIRRVLRGQSPFVGGKDHITHHLAYLGLKDDKVVMMLSAISLGAMALAFCLVYYSGEFNFIYSIISIIYFIIVYGVLQYLYSKAKPYKKEE